MYAAGKIPGGFIKREGRPSETAILTSRLTDRPLRPLFPKGYYYEIQVMVTVLSVDMENDPEHPVDHRRSRGAVASPTSRSPGRSARPASATSTASSC